LEHNLQPDAPKSFLISLAFCHQTSTPNKKLMAESLISMLQEQLGSATRLQIEQEIILVKGVKKKSQSSPAISMAFKLCS
ncbi:hypothetical protein TorRG33x02_116640, partial [Trema orientale]